jgi:Ras GTPase-activating-like protein IQGAP2/3
MILRSFALQQQDQVQLLDLEYVHFNVNKILALLTKTFIKR